MNDAKSTFRKTKHIGQQGTSERILVNDRHSGLNPTIVTEVAKIDSLESIRVTIHRARRKGQAISIAGAGYAMGGQQFLSNDLHLDTRKLNRILHFDMASGLIEVEAGIHWADLIPQYVKLQQGSPNQWGIAQKQTGADHLSLGGALSVNIHGRGLHLPPLVSNIESFQLVDSNGELKRCSRTENTELFRLAIGGFGLFGIIYSLTLRLEPRHKVQRVAQVLQVENLISTWSKQRVEGYTAGHFQFAIAPESDDFLRKGVLVSFNPVQTVTPVSDEAQEFLPDQWISLLYLAHIDKPQAFKMYADHFLAHQGELFWSDTHQLGIYQEGYHKWLDDKLGSSSPGSEIITELFVPPHQLEQFLQLASREFRQSNTDVIYGTVRLVERDEETFLRWAKKDWACIVFNLHTSHSLHEIQKSILINRRLIDCARQLGGTYYLPYHKWATREQVEACYPEFQEFLGLKRQYDPEERFQSNWYRHYKNMFSHQRGNHDSQRNFRYSMV